MFDIEWVQASISIVSSLILYPQLLIKCTSPSFDIVSNLFFKNSHMTIYVFLSLTNEFPIQHLIFEYCPVSDCILWVGYVNNFGKVESSWLFFYWAPTPSKEYK